MGADQSGGDDERFQLAVGAAKRIVRQSRAHAHRVAVSLPRWGEGAPASSPFGVDRAAEAVHPVAFSQRLRHVEACNTALVSHLSGLEALFRDITFRPLPAVSIARSIAEVAASAAWILDTRVDRDTRTARAYASLFRSIETYSPRTRGRGTDDLDQLREKISQEVQGRGGRTVRRIKNGEPTPEIAQVTLQRGHAKVGFQYSQRIAEEIPLIGNTYAGMSGMVHGEPQHITTTSNSPGTMARLIGLVVRRSVEAWSNAIHLWIDAETAAFINEDDWDDLTRSMPPELIAQFEAESLVAERRARDVS